jgi:hypothetical protein
MFYSRVRLSDRNLAQRLGRHVRVGEAFLFYDSDPQDQEWVSWFRRKFTRPPTAGPLVVPLLTSRVVEVPGGWIEPLRLPQLRLDGITSDKAVYRTGCDTVHLLVFALGRPGELVSLAVYANRMLWSRLPVLLDHHGVALVPLRDLPSGNYEIHWPDASPAQAGSCTFAVAEYRLAPLVATLLERHWDEAAGLLFLRIRLETFGVALTGAVRVELTCAGQRVADRRGQSVDGLLDISLPLAGDGAHTLNVQLESDPARTATIPLLGTSGAERFSTLFSTMGNEVRGSLLPGTGSRPVRGLFLTEGAAQETPFRLERVDTDRVRLIASVAAGPVSVLAVDLLNHERTQELSRPRVAAGEILEIDVPGPASVLLVGAFVAGVTWEGCSAVLQPERLTACVSVPQRCRPDTDVTITVTTGRSDHDGVAYLIVKDARLLSPQTPGNCLAGQIKSAVGRLAVQTHITPQALDHRFHNRRREDIGDVLVLRGLISPEQLTEARELAWRIGSHPHDNLVQFGYATHEEITKALAAVHRVEFIDLANVTIAQGVIDQMPESVARENIVLLLASQGDTFTIAVSDCTDFEMIEKLRFILNKDIRPVVSPRQQIIDAINRHYGQSETESVDSLLAEFTDTALDREDVYLGNQSGPPTVLRRPSETSLDIGSLSEADEPAEPEPTQVHPGTTLAPEVIFAGLIPLHQGQAAQTVHLGAGVTDYIAEVFVVSGLDWAPAGARFRAEKDPFVILDLPAFVHRHDNVMARVHAGARSGRMRLRVTCDGVEVPLQYEGSRLSPTDELSATQATVILDARPGEYRATVEDLAGGSDEMTGRIEEPGKLRSVARSLRFLEPGQSLSREDPSIVALRVLPGLDRPLHSLVNATADYEHLCCEQTAAKILAGCAMYALAGEDSERRARGEAIIRAGVAREALMWLRGRGFKMYPTSADQSHAYLGLRAAGYLKQLSLLSQLDDGSFSPALRAAIDQGLTMADDVYQAQRSPWPPTAATNCAEAYNVLRFGGTGTVADQAADLVRRRTVSGPDLRVLPVVDLPDLKGAVLERAEAAYASAALLRTGNPSDRTRAWALANSVLQNLGPEGRLYSTVDSVAALALLAELRTVGVSGIVEMDGRHLSTADAVKEDHIRTLTGVAGVTCVEVTRWVVEDWDQIRSTVRMHVALEQGGQKVRGSEFTVGDGLDLSIRLEDGYQDGDLLWVCLPDALSWVFGGGQVKRFAVDLAARNEVRVPLAVTAMTQDRLGRSAPQHFSVCLRNMFEEERAGNPGPLQVAAVPRVRKH